MIDQEHDETFGGLKRWWERSEHIIDAIGRRHQRQPAFDPFHWCDLWLADRTLLIEVMASTRARSLDAVLIKLRALLSPCGAPTGGLFTSIVRDIFAMLAPA